MDLQDTQGRAEDSFKISDGPEMDRGQLIYLHIAHARADSLVEVASGAAWSFYCFPWDHWPSAESPSLSLTPARRNTDISV